MKLIYPNRQTITGLTKAAPLMVIILFLSSCVATLPLSPPDYAYRANYPGRAPSSGNYDNDLYYSEQLGGKPHSQAGGYHGNNDQYNYSDSLSYRDTVPSSYYGDYYGNDDYYRYNLYGYYYNSYWPYYVYWPNYYYWWPYYHGYYGYYYHYPYYGHYGHYGYGHYGHGYGYDRGGNHYYGRRSGYNGQRGSYSNRTSTYQGRAANYNRTSTSSYGQRSSSATMRSRGGPAFSSPNSVRGGFGSTGSMGKMSSGS